MIIAYRLKNKLKELFRKSWKFISRLPSHFELYGARIAAGLLPGLFQIERERLYPPAGVAPSTVCWVRTAGERIGASVREIDPPCTVDNPMPKTIHAHIRRQFLVDEHYDYPKTFVASIPGGRVWGDGHIITPDDQLLDDVSWDFRALETYLPSTTLFWSLQALRKIDGTVLVLSTDASALYYHWLFQQLPRLELARRAGVNLGGIDYVLVSSQKARFQRDTLAILGVDPGKIIESDKVGYLRARELVVPSIALGGGCFRPWMCDFLRNAFISKNRDQAKISSRRIYISRARAGYRRVLNETAVINLLRRRGFEIAEFEKLSIVQQATTIAACEVIVAPHGGGLSNLIFCTPGTKVVEIFSPELVATYFWKICNRVGLDYYYLLGKGDPVSQDTDYPQSWNSRADIEVDLKDLEKTLDLANIK